MKKKRIIIFALVIIALLCTSLAVSAATKEIVVKHTALNTGVVFVWSNGQGVWQNGLCPGGNCTREFSFTVGKGDCRNVSVEAYNYANFNFKQSDVSGWNPTKMAKDKNSYDLNYMKHAAINADINTDYDNKTHKLTITQEVILNSLNDFDIAEKVRWNQQQDVYDYLGDDIPDNITGPMNNMLSDPKVKGYLYFCPLVITWEEVETVEIGDLIANLMIYGDDGEITNKVQVGEGYSVTDESEFLGTEFESSELEYSLDGGKTWIKVESWDGTKQGAELDVLTRKNPDNPEYYQISHDGGKTWIDGGKSYIE